MPAPLVGWTYCSGIGAPEVAAPWIDWRLASEISAFPRAVLAHRFGYQPHPRAPRVLWSDFSAMRARHLARFGIAPPNLILAGTPCQAFSLAGARQSLGDARGNLTLEFVRNVKSLARLSPALRWVVWENVPGVLSTADNAFGCFLGGLVGAPSPIAHHRGGSWPSVGMVSGPLGRAAWRVFNAEHFGVAQRRRRLFLVWCPGVLGDPAAVLFERARGGRDFDSGLFAGANGSAQPGGGAAAPGGDADMTAEGPVYAFSSKDRLTDVGTVSPPLRSMNHDKSAINGGGQVAVCYAIQGRAVSVNLDAGPQGKGWQPDLAYTLEANGSTQMVGPVWAIQARTSSPSLSHGAAAAPWRQDVAWTMLAGGDPQIVAAPETHIVRRITPVEAERLQGFPDGHTCIPWRRRLVDAATADWLRRQSDGAITFEPDAQGRGIFTNAAPDHRRYHALGNSQAVPNIAWILDRIRAAEAVAA